MPASKALRVRVDLSRNSMNRVLSGRSRWGSPRLNFSLSSAETARASSISSTGQSRLSMKSRPASAFLSTVCLVLQSERDVDDGRDFQFARVDRHIRLRHVESTRRSEADRQPMNLSRMELGLGDPNDRAEPQIKSFRVGLGL